MENIHLRRMSYVNKSVSDSKQQSVPPVPKEEISERLSVVFKKDAEDFYTQKLKDLQNRNAALQKQTNEEFAKAVKEVEAKFLNVTACPVCEDLQMKVLECYQNNPREILNCSSVVNAFTSCVERARMFAFSRDGPDTEVLSFLGEDQNCPIQQHHYQEFQQ